MRLPALPSHAPPGLVRCALHVALAGCLTTMPALPAALAVSGGGKDFSGASIEGLDFAGQTLNGKEFRGSRGAGAKFDGAALRSCSFFQADLSKASFEKADLTGASLEEAGLDGVSFKGAVLTSSYLTRTILDAQDITGADCAPARLACRGEAHREEAAHRARRAPPPRARVCRHHSQRGRDAREDLEGALRPLRRHRGESRHEDGDARVTHVPRLRRARQTADE